LESHPSFRPTEWVGFFHPGQTTIKKVSLSGGTVTPIARINLQPLGITWGDDDTIIFGTTNSGLWRVSANGGDPTPLTTLAANQQFHNWPERLPDGAHLLFHSGEGFGAGSIELFSLETGGSRFLFEGEAAHYLPSGHVVVAQGGSLKAVPFDLRRLEPTGPWTTVMSDVFTDFSAGLGHWFDIAPSGDMVLSRGVAADKSIVWLDRSGHETHFTNVETNYHTLRLSSDDSRVLAHDLTVGALWVHDFAREARGLVIRAPSVLGPCVWNPLEDEVFFTLESELYRKAADGTGEAILMLAQEHQQWITSISQDGRSMVFTEVHPVTGRDIWSLDSEGNAQSLIVTDANENAAAFSPDGRWLAYQSDTSGRAEVYVQPFPGPGLRVLVSTDGGKAPVWSPKGDELFYRQGSAMMAVRVEADSELIAGKPELLFDGPYQADSTGHPSYDVTADGQRFVMIRREPPAFNQFSIILNWPERLKRLVPSGS
jgi:serine/threonine-protein kinase